MDPFCTSLIGGAKSWKLFGVFVLDAKHLAKHLSGIHHPPAWEWQQYERNKVAKCG